MVCLRVVGWLQNESVVVIPYTQVDTIRYLSGVTLNKKYIPVRKPVILLVILVALFLSACSTVQNNNWPGIASDGDSIVYASFGESGILAYDVNDQEELWSVNPNSSEIRSGSDENRASPPVYASPSLKDGRLIVGDYGISGGFFSPGVQVQVYSLKDISSSDDPIEDWTTTSELVQDRIIAQALQVDDREYNVDDRVFIGTNDNKVLAFDATTGEPLWRDAPETEQNFIDGILDFFRRPPCEVGCFEAEHSIWGRMNYETGTLYVPSLDTNVYALDATTLEELWSSNVGGSVSDKLVINDDTVYASSFDRNLYALDKDDGSIRWTVEAEASIWGAPTYEDGVVYVVDIDGNVRAVTADDGEVLWSTSLEQYVVAAPVVVDGTVFIASGGDPEIDRNDRTGALIALDTETGKETWREETRLPVFATPVVASDIIALATNSQDILLEMKFFDLENLNTNWTYAPESEGG
jgi:outer membrane protein assembly factor BamB